MGINAAFSSWLRGVQSTVSSGIRAAQNFGAAFQAQTMTALNTAQRAVTQPFQPQQTQQRSATPNPYTARTITPATIVGGAARTIQGGVRGAQQAAQQIVRAHAPIVQGVRRDASRAIRAAPAAIQSAPRSVQQAAQQISRAHAPIVQGVQRDASRAISAAPAAIQSAPRSVQQAAQQISRAHAPIVQGVQRDASRAIRAAPAAIQSAPRSVQQATRQISRTHAPIIQGVRRDASAAIRSVGGAGAPRQVSPRITYGPGGGAGGRGESATVKAPRVQRTDPLSIAGGVAQYWLATPDRTKPVFDWGQGAGQWWTQNAAPAIEKWIDAFPYLGPRTLHRIEGGQVIPVTAGPLTGGGTRLKPNWEGYLGHEALKGLTVDAPKYTLEFVTAAPLGVERAAGMALYDPVGAAAMTGGGLVAVGEGTVAAAKENPGRFIGATVGSRILGRAGGAAYTKGVKPAMISAGEATGVVRKQTYGFGGKANTNPVQYMSRAESLETILENPTVSGVRAASAPVGTFARDAGLIPTRKMQIRNPAAVGDVPAGQSVSAEGVFMALSRPGLIEPYGTWFTKGGTKRGGLKGKVLGSRVYLHENIRTVQIPKALKDRIYQRVRETGEFWGEDYDMVLKLAKEQSKKYGEPVAVPSPKRAIGNWEPENEAFLVFADDVSRKITGTQFAGLSSEGTIVKRITVGRQAPITQTRLGSVAENLRYNWDLGRDGLRIYNRRYLEAQTKDMARKKAELYEGALSYPGEYAGHGVGHAQGVQSGLMWQRSVSPTLQQAATPSEMWMRAKYHDIAKIGDADTQPYPHGWAAGTAIKKGMIQDPDLLALPKETQMAIGRDIQLHTDIQPTLRSQIRYRPSATAKALATADRLDLTRFGVPVKSSKLFPVPEETLGFKVGQVADRLPIGFQVRFVDAPAPLSGGAATTAKSSSGGAKYLAPARPSTPTLTSAAPKGGETLDYQYLNSGKPAAKSTLIPPAKEYGGRARPYEEPYAAPYGEKYPLYGGPYATPYGTQYLEPAPPYPAPYSEPYPAAPYSPPYPEPYVAPPYGGPYPPPYPGPYGTPYAPPSPGTYPPTPARPRSQPYTPYSKPPAGAPAPKPPQKDTRKTSKRRRKRPGELDHWEYGPAPGLKEMHGLIFGSPDWSLLDFGPPGLSVLNLGGSPTPGGQPSFGFAARAPARPPVIPSFGPPAKAPGKKPAHAGKTPAKKKNHGILNDGHRPTIPKTKPRTTNARTPDRRRDPAAGRNPARDARPGHRPAQKSARKRDQSK